MIVFKCIIQSHVKNGGKANEKQLIIDIKLFLFCYFDTWNFIWASTVNT